MLNEKLMEEALLVPNIRFFSEHKTQAVDFHRRIASVHDVVGDTTKQIKFDLCIGADGSYSVVRRQLMRVTRCVCVMDSICRFVTCRRFKHSSHPPPLPRLAFATRRNNGILSFGPFR